MIKFMDDYIYMVSNMCGEQQLKRYIEWYLRSSCKILVYVLVLLFCFFSILSREWYVWPEYVRACYLVHTYEAYLLETF